MKKIKVNKKDFWLIILPPIIQSILYFIVKLFAFKIHLVSSPIDDKIPFIAQFVYPYILWYLMLIIVPYIIYKYERNKLEDYDKLFLICSLLCSIIFIVYPTTINRKAIEVNNLATFIVNIIYYFDTPALNCFPSLHTLNSLMWIIFFSKSDNTPKKIKFAVIIVSILVILATLFIKQHVIWDLVGSMIVLGIGLCFLKIFKHKV